MLTSCKFCSCRTNEFTKSELPISLAHMRYNTLREKSPRLLGVFYSTIHGRGLFTRRDIQEGEMVIEYVGEVTRLFGSCSIGLIEASLISSLI